MLIFYLVCEFFFFVSFSLHTNMLIMEENTCNRSVAVQFLGSITVIGCSASGAK